MNDTARPRDDRGHHGLRPLAPSPWVIRFAPLVPAGAPVLDVACGAGRHLRVFLARGHPVTGVDRDLSRMPKDLRRHPRLTLVEADLEAEPWPFADARFGGVVVTNYLYRPLFPHLIAALAPGGVLIYETFARGNERFGRPRRPEHLLEEGELLELVRGKLTVIAFEDLEIAHPRPARIQRLCARRPGPE